MMALYMTLSDPNPSFKVTLQFEGEYLANSACYGQQHDVDRAIAASHAKSDAIFLLGKCRTRFPIKVTKFRACLAWFSRSDVGQRTDRRGDSFIRH